MCIHRLYIFKRCGHLFIPPEPLAACPRSVYYPHHAAPAPSASLPPPSPTPTSPSPSTAPPPEARAQTPQKASCSLEHPCTHRSAHPYHTFLLERQCLACERTTSERVRCSLAGLAQGFRFGAGTSADVRRLQGKDAGERGDGGQRRGSGHTWSVRVLADGTQQKTVGGLKLGVDLGRKRG